MSTNQGFFYIDGIPTKGLWIDLDDVAEWAQIEEKLLGLFPGALIDEILCADIEGLPKHFYASNCDGFDMDGWAAFLEDKETTHLDDEVIDAYFDNNGVSSISDIEEAYQGEFSSDEAFADDYIDSTGMLSEVPENLRFYFDTEKFARDMMFDFFESNGHYFRNL